MQILLEAHPGLGTLWWIEIDDACSTELVLNARETVATTMVLFEEAYSRFRESSLLSQLNRERQLVNAPEELIDMLQRAARYERMTNGVFTLAVGSTLEQLGYGLPSKTRVDTALIPQSNTMIDISGRTIALKGSLRIDLGGIGKAYLIERLGLLLERQGVTQYLINGGGDILVKSEEEIVLEIEHPKEPTLSIASIPVSSGAICTSSPFKRVWKDAEGIARQHLVNPSHAQTDVEQFREAATVCAPSIVDADVYATVCAILGSTQWGEIQRLSPLFHASILLCDSEGQVHTSHSLHSFIH